MANRKPTIRELDSAYIKQREQEKQLQLKRKRGLMRRLTVLGFVGFIILGIVSATLITQAKSIGEKKKNRQPYKKSMMPSLRNRKSLNRIFRIIIILIISEKFSEGIIF